MYMCYIQNTFATISYTKLKKECKENLDIQINECDMFANCQHTAFKTNINYNKMWHVITSIFLLQWYWQKSEKTEAIIEWHQYNIEISFDKSIL